MELGMIGLGRMGADMVRRLQLGDHRVVVHNRSREPIDELAGEGAVPAYTLEELVSSLPTPRVVWMMIPAGQPVDDQIAALGPLLSPGDIIVDGGNSKFSDTIARGEKLSDDGLHYIDAGTSGGVWGLEVGYCLMVGGEDAPVKILEPALKTLAPENGYLHVGPSGAGHYVKMVHNGIEYGMMAAFAEGFEIMHESRYDLDLEAISNLWNQGSVVRSWLLELAALAFAQDPNLDHLRGYVGDSGEGRWTVFESIDLDVAAPVIYMSLAMRFLSRKEDTFGNKVLAALRQQFGGHAVQRTAE
ncbi:decarboxylating 6-phosphogluconate dehydrogenase [soil metagenome]